MDATLDEQEERLVGEVLYLHRRETNPVMILAKLQELRALRAQIYRHRPTEQRPSLAPERRVMRTRVSR